MKFTNNSSTLCLEILGYEYPNSHDKFDSNWLSVSVEVTAGNDYWKAKDASLRTFELVNLRSWLLAIINENPISNEINFTENELAFRYEYGKLIVILDFNFHPKGDDYDEDNEYCFEVKLTLKGLSKIIEELSEYIDKFPEKCLIL